MKSLLLSALVASTAIAAPKGKSKGKPSKAGKGSVWPQVDYLFTFGDSYTTTGFDVNGPQPSRENPIGNPAYPGNTQTNAPTYTDYLTTLYNESFVELYNFGFGGATIDINIDPSPFGYLVQSFRQQVENEFLPNYGNGVNPPWNGDNSLFTVFFGINDLILINGKDNFRDLTAQLVASYRMLVNELYDAGARNFFFLSVPNISRVPGNPAAPAEKIMYFNSQFEDFFNDFAENKAGVTVFTLDLYKIWDQVLDKPTTYEVTSGLKNTTDQCPSYNQYTDTSLFVPSCGVPVYQYFWADGLHPTHVVDKLIAQQMVLVMTCPGNSYHYGHGCTKIRSG